MAIERRHDALALARVAQDLIGHRLVGPRPAFADVVELVQRARVRVDPLEHALHRGLGDEREHEIRLLEDEAGLPRHVRAQLDAGADDRQ
jgi:hypothetical protein